MRNHQRSTWLSWLTALLAGLGLALGSVACEPAEENYEDYEGVDEEVTGIQQEEPLADDQTGTFEEEIEPEGVEQEQLGQQQQQEEVAVDELNPEQISDQDLAQFAQLRLRLMEARQDGAIGGGPIENEQLEEWETEMIQNAGMEVDRYLAIRMMLQENPQLQERYDKVLLEMHE
jgi:hypothetical protein